MRVIIGLLFLFGLVLIFPGFATVLLVVVGIGLALGLLGVLLTSIFHGIVTGGPK